MIRFPFSRFIVKDHSMEPVFLEFDRVVTYNWGKLQKRSVIVFRQKNDYFIKRVDKIKNGVVFVSGDNKKQSAKMAPVKTSDVVGRVFLKY